MTVAAARFGPAATRPAILSQARCRAGVARARHAWPEGAPPEQGEQRRHQRETGDQGHEHAEAEHGCEPFVLAVRGEQQREHGQRHGEAAGRDRLPCLSQRRRQGHAVVGLAAQLLAVARDQQQGVVGAGAEEEDDHERGGLAREGRAHRRGARRQYPSGDEVAEADRDQRHEGQDRRAVDEKQQDEYQDDGADEQLDVGVKEDLVDVGDETAGASHADLHPPDLVAEVRADRLHGVTERTLPGVAGEGGEDQGSLAVGRVARRACLLWARRRSSATPLPARSPPCPRSSGGRLSCRRR